MNKKCHMLMVITNGSALKTLKVLKTTAEVAKLLFIEAISDQTDNDNESAHFVRVERNINYNLT